MTRPARDDLPSAEVLLVDRSHHQRHSARDALLGRVELPQHLVGAGARMTLRAIKAQGGRHDAHGVEELVDGNPLEHLNVLEDGLGHLRPGPCRSLARGGREYASADGARERDSSDDNHRDDRGAGCIPQSHVCASESLHLYPAIDTLI